MPTAEKAQTIEAAKEWYQRSKGVVFTDYRGLKVKEMQQLRANLKAKGCEIHVIKNTLFRQAVGEDAEKLPYEFHNGPTAVAFVFEDESATAKALLDYAQTNKNLHVKGGFIGGRTMSVQEVTALSKLPSREVLIAQVIGTIAAPLSNLVGVIEALYADPIRVIGAVADKMAEGSPAPVAEAAPAPIAEAAPAAEAAPVAEATAEAETTTTEAPATDSTPAEAEAEAPAPSEEAEPAPAEEPAQE